MNDILNADLLNIDSPLAEEVRQVNARVNAKFFDAPHHYFATSVAHWLVTTDKRGLADVLAEMDRDGYDYSLWLVPGAWNEDYEIRMYAPQVEGAKLVGVFRKGEVK